MFSNSLHLKFTISYLFFVLSLQKQQHPDPKELQISVTGFLNGKNARIFMGELWALLVSAQENIGGVPADFLEKKKEEIRKRKVRERNSCVSSLKDLFVQNENIRQKLHV